MATSTMQDHTQLVVTRCLEYAARYHADTEVISRTVEGPTVRSNYKEVHDRAKALALTLLDLGVKPGDRVATMAWNTHRHLEAWYAIMGIGAICHTLNPRLFDADIEYIANHAEDSIVLLDISFAAKMGGLKSKLPTVKRFIFLTDEAHMPRREVAVLGGALCYETLVSNALPRAAAFTWPYVDERTPCGLCYTSGTTGRPKGVQYTHRSNMLHALAVSLPDGMGASSRDSMMMVVPMFHANSWGIAFAAPIVGMRLVLPASYLDGKNAYELMRAEKVTHSAGVPTVWLALQAYMEEHNLQLPDLKVLVVGGAAAPRKLFDFFWERQGIDLRQMWGMTETSPLGTLGTMKSPPLSRNEELKRRLTQGRPHIFADLRIVGEDGKELPWDGKAFGNLHIRGPAVLSQYFRHDKPAVDDQDWFDTGDVSTISPDGWMQITDRSKDVIKSGGEWISSIEIENVAVGHPKVAEAAVIAIPHPKWTERPLLVVAAKPGAAPTKESVLEFLKGKIAKWWMPDDVLFVKEIPHTATGKISKLTLRKQLGGYSFGDSSTGDFTVAPRSKL